MKINNKLVTMCKNNSLKDSKFKAFGPLKLSFILSER
ncbi:hypothetical protein SDC9_132689 [bioreactor metagenome]|uniref:Uncharacterized protein n=1 Tax=bioreactor metagenome TaxID=1076179 RepID=A0A645D980_9ZZZZ